MIGLGPFVIFICNDHSWWWLWRINEGNPVSLVTYCARVCLYVCVCPHIYIYNHIYKSYLNNKSISYTLSCSTAQWIIGNWLFYIKDLYMQQRKGHIKSPAKTCFMSTDCNTRKCDLTELCGSVCNVFIMLQNGKLFRITVYCQHCLPPFIYAGYFRGQLSRAIDY